MSIYFAMIIIILCSILLSAFFSGMEIAYVSVNRLQLELEKKQNTIYSRILSVFGKSPSTFITTMLVGNNIALVVYSLFMGALIVKLLFPSYQEGNFYWLLFIQTLISTIIILVTAEFIPKALFRINPKFILLFFSIPAYFFYILFYPITKITIVFSRFFIHNIFKFKFEKNEETKVFGKTDLTALVDNEKFANDKKQTSKPEITFFKNVLNFSDIKIRECLIPRNEIVAISVDDTIENIKKKFIENEFSRIVVYQNSIENIIGYVHSSELFKNPSALKEALTTIPIVPESMPANKLLTTFSDENKGLALVVDEFGGTAGIVTIEDILEEIVGEIEDEHDTTTSIDKKLSNTEYILSGRQEIDYVNEKYNLNLPNNENYETVAGLVLHIRNAIPKKNETIPIPNLQMSFKILEVTSTQVKKVLLLLHSKQHFINFLSIYLMAILLFFAT